MHRQGSWMWRCSRARAGPKAWCPRSVASVPAEQRDAGACSAAGIHSDGAGSRPVSGKMPVLQNHGAMHVPAAGHRPPGASRNHHPVSKSSLSHVRRHGALCDTFCALWCFSPVCWYSVHLLTTWHIWFFPYSFLCCKSLDCSLQPPKSFHSLPLVIYVPVFFTLWFLRLFFFLQPVICSTCEISRLFV